MCSEPKCTSRVKYIEGGEKGKCRAHGGYPLCSEPECTSRVAYVEGGENGKCSAHGGYPLCSEPKCTSRVAYVEGGEKGKCSAHGGHPKCSEPKCTSRVKYIEGGEKGKCSAHGGYPMCSESGCTSRVKYAEGGEKGKCIAHGGYPKCSESGCTSRVAYVEGGEKGKCRAHGGYPKCRKCMFWSVKKQGTCCATCTPGSVSSKRMKREEEVVAAALSAHGYTFQREVRVAYSCLSSDVQKSARLDFVLELPDKRVILEVDERQHKDGNYTVGCDVARMAFVMAAIVADDNSRPTLWLRFNPDGYKVGGVVRRTPKKVKLAQLVDTIRTLRLKAHFAVQYLYYDVDERGVLELCSDPQYSAEFRQHLMTPVV
jgi:hypothetical protein